MAAGLLRSHNPAFKTNLLKNVCESPKCMFFESYSMDNEVLGKFLCEISAPPKSPKKSYRYKLHTSEPYPIVGLN